jgi:hypothetical protein
MPNGAARSLSRLRRLLHLVVLAGLAGTTVDLLFLDHHESVLQFTPFAAITLAAAALLWQLLAGSRHSALAVQVAMALLLATGGVGIGLHFDGSAEFQLESDPAASGWPLVRKALESKAPPVMAPANLALLGLVGLASMYRLEAPDEDRTDA